MKVTPHPAFVAHVRARRGPLDFAPPIKPCKPSAVWETFRGIDKRGWQYQRVKNEEEAREVVRMANRGALGDLRTVAVAERLMWRGYNVDDGTNTLVQIVAGELGVAKMVEMKLTSSTIGIFEKESRIAFDEGEQAVHDASWDLARAIVCRADDAAYAAARDLAAKWRSSRPVAARVFADFLFPAEVAWANADLDEINPIALTSPSHLWGRAQGLLSVTDDAARATALLDQLNDYAVWSFAGQWSCDVAVSLPPADATRVLCKILERCKRAGKTQLAVLGAAMCALEGEEMAAQLAGLLLHSPIGPLAVDYFKRFPDLARVALPKIASGASKAADAARSILATSAKKDDVPLADASEVPRPLRDTPWRGRKKSKPVTLSITPPVPATTIEWKDGEQEKARTTTSWYARSLVPMSDAMLAEWEREAKLRRPVDIWVRWGTQRGSYEVPTEESIREWNENPSALATLGPMRMLAMYGERVLPGLFAREATSSGWNDDALLDAQLHAIGRESSILAAYALSRRKTWKRRAHDWLVAHAAVAAQSLVPLALAGDGRERKDAETAVRVIARANRAAVENAAEALGADAERATRELVDRDPLVDLEPKGKLPPFVKLEDLPFVKTKNGNRLPDDALAALLEILRSTSIESPYAGLDEIKEGLDEASLGEFAWALVQSWILAGSKGAYDWISYALALIGDDACARRLAPYVRDWARKDAKKAKLAVDVLAAMGSPAALLHLSYVADKSRFEEAKTHAKETLERTASAQGLTTDELADRTVPDLELDANGTATLDFGARTFTVTFDEGLRPVLRTEDGAPLAAFPRATKADDAALAKAASARFKALKVDAESVAQSLLRRFEASMVRGRTWSAASFREHVVGHPLVTHLARRLVWSAGAGAFRVAEDGSFAGADDAEYTLSDDAIVTLPHPLVLGADAVATWSRIVADYGVVQPFEQIGRATFAAGDDAGVPKLERYAGRKSKPGPLMGSLDARGWQKWPDETSLSSAGKKVRTTSGAEAHVMLAFSPGIELSDVAGSEEQSLHAPSLSGAASFGDLDPIDFSELVRDLEFIAH